MHSISACVEAQAARGKGTPCVHDAGDVTHVGCSTSSPLRKRCATSEEKMRTKNNAKLICVAVWRDCRDCSLVLQCYKCNIFIIGTCTGPVWGVI